MLDASVLRWILIAPCSTLLGDNARTPRPQRRADSGLSDQATTVRDLSAANASTPRVALTEARPLSGGSPCTRSARHPPQATGTGLGFALTGEEEAGRVVLSRSSVSRCISEAIT